MQNHENNKKNIEKEEAFGGEEGRKLQFFLSSPFYSFPSPFSPCYVGLKMDIILSILAIDSWL